MLERPSCLPALLLLGALSWSMASCHKEGGGSEAAEADSAGTSGDSEAAQETASPDDSAGAAGDSEAAQETASPDDSAASPASGPGRVIAYYTEWSVYGRDYPVEDIPAEKLTHINYAFLDLSAAGDCLIHDRWAALELDGGNLAKLRALRAEHPHLKLLFSVGGWTLSAHFSAVASTAEGRAAMIESCVQVMTEQGFDGLDIDWEYPVSGGLYGGQPADRENYTLLMQGFREALDAAGEGYLLSIAAPAGPSTIPNLDLPGLEPSLDFINLMSYDLHGGWESSTHFNAPLFPSSDSPCAEEASVNVAAAVQTYLEAGIPPEKIVLGMPAYGRGWSGVPDINAGLFQSSTGLPEGTWEPGVFDYAHIVELLASSGWERHWHEEALVPWLFHADEGIFISYDDEESFGHKLDTLQEQGLGGAVVWALSSDTEDHALISLLHQRLQPE